MLFLIDGIITVSGSHYLLDQMAQNQSYRIEKVIEYQLLTEVAVIIFGLVSVTVDQLSMIETGSIVHVLKLFVWIYVLAVLPVIKSVVIPFVVIHVILTLSMIVYTILIRRKYEIEGNFLNCC